MIKRFQNRGVGLMGVRPNFHLQLNCRTKFPQDNQQDSTDYDDDNFNL